MRILSTLFLYAGTLFMQVQKFRNQQKNKSFIFLYLLQKKLFIFIEEICLFCFVQLSNQERDLINIWRKKNL